MKKRRFKSHEPVNGLPALAADGKVSMGFSFMRNKDIERYEATGDPTELIEKSKKQHQNYLNKYGTDSCNCQKKPDGTWLKKGVA